MEITLIAQRNDAPLSLAKAGETLTINGVELDFSKLMETAEWKELDDENFNQAVAFNNPLLAHVRRDNGVIHAWVIYPYAAGEQPQWGEATLTVDVDGAIPLPA